MDLLSRKPHDLFRVQVGKDQAKDTGLVIVLVLLILTLWLDDARYVWGAIGFLLITMTVPVLFLPLAKIWFGLSVLLGTVVSKIILTLLFFCIVTPVAVARRWMGIDRLMLKKWKKDSSSVFVERNHSYRADEIERPY